MNESSNFEFLPSPVLIGEQEWPEGTIPFVSICCITYNHEKYIRDCIEGFLIQKTTFPVEIIIHDDASSDKTADIIKEYVRKFPNLIQPIFQSENQYSIRNSPMRKFIWPIANGDYMALCEGDDYWIDTYKLQKQVTFLEANLDYGMVHTSIKIFNQKNKKLSSKIYKDRCSSFSEMLVKNRVYTLTVLMRKKLAFQYLQEISPDDKKWKMGDYPMWLWFSYNSKIKLLNDCTSVYRQHIGSASRPVCISKKIEFLNSTFEIKNFFIEKYGCDLVTQKKILYYSANSKIKKGILIDSYNLHREGMKDKIQLGYSLTLFDHFFSFILKYNTTKLILRYVVNKRSTFV